MRPQSSCSIFSQASVSLISSVKLLFSKFISSSFSDSKADSLPTSSFASSSGCSTISSFFSLSSLPTTLASCPSGPLLTSSVRVIFSLSSEAPSGNLDSGAEIDLVASSTISAMLLSSVSIGLGSELTSIFSSNLVSMPSPPLFVLSSSKEIVSVFSFSTSVSSSFLEKLFESLSIDSGFLTLSLVALS